MENPTRNTILIEKEALYPQIFPFFPIFLYSTIFNNTFPEDGHSPKLVGTKV